MKNSISKFLVMIVSAAWASFSLGGGITGTDGTVGKQLEILNQLSQIDASQERAVFITDSAFINLLGTFSLNQAQLDLLETSGISIDQLIVKDGISGIQSYNILTDNSFYIFSDSQKPLIQKTPSFLEKMQTYEGTSFFIDNH